MAITGNSMVVGGDNFFYPLRMHTFCQGSSVGNVFLMIFLPLSSPSPKLALLIKTGSPKSSFFHKVNCLVELGNISV